MDNLDLEAIAEICAKYRGSDYYVPHLAPPSVLPKIMDKIVNARVSFPIPDEEHVIALVDSTAFNSGKRGLAICSTGIYWRNDWTVTSANHYWDWESFSLVHLQDHDKHSLSLGSGNLVNLAGSAMDRNQLLSLLQELQRFIGGVYIESSARIIVNYEGQEPELEWLIAVAGKQYGPYDRHTLRTMFVTKQILPEETYLWTHGMSEWVPFLQVPEVASLVPPVGPPSAPVSASALTTAPSAVVEMSEEPSTASGSRPINVNTASWESLLELPGLTLSRAKRLVQQREAIGGLGSAEEMGELLQLKPHEVVKLRRLVTF